MDSGNRFLNTISTMRRQEEVLLFQDEIQISKEEELEVTDFLQKEYEQECLTFPSGYPAFSPAAALWGAKTVYLASVLLLFRKTKPENLHDLFPAFSHKATASEMLSADLCLRFLPFLVVELKHIELEDPLILILEKHLIDWHYSALGTNSLNPDFDPEVILQNKSFLKLYIDRILTNRDEAMAKHPAFISHVKAALGIYTKNYWPEFDSITKL